MSFVVPPPVFAHLVTTGLGPLFEDLETKGSLPGDDIRVVEGRQHGHAFLRHQAIHLFLRVVLGAADDAHLRSLRLDAVDLVLGRRHEELHLVPVVITNGDDRADGHHTIVFDLAHLGVLEDVTDLTDARLHHSLVVLGGVVLGVLTQIAVVTGFRNPLLDGAPTIAGGRVLFRRCLDGSVLSYR